MHAPPPRDVADATAPRDAAVRVRGVTKSFGAGGSLTRALRGVDLDVPSWRRARAIPL